MADLEHTLTAGGVCVGVWPTTPRRRGPDDDDRLAGPTRLLVASVPRARGVGVSIAEKGVTEDSPSVTPALSHTATTSCASGAPNAPAATDITGASSCLTTSPPSADPPGAQVPLHVRLHLEILPRSWAMGRQVALECRRGGLVGLIIGVVHGACLSAPLPSLRDLDHR